jgi:hypothetical protein
VPHEQVTYHDPPQCTTAGENDSCSYAGRLVWSGSCTKEGSRYKCVHYAPLDAEVPAPPPPPPPAPKQTSHPWYWYLWPPNWFK